MWNFRGTPAYLNVQARRLGVTPILADRARRNVEIHRVSTLLGQLAERYQTAPKEGGRAVLYLTELAQAKGTLGQCDQEVEKLHMLAAAAQSMVDEGYRAFGLDPPERIFGVTCAFDEPVPVNGKAISDSPPVPSAVPPASSTTPAASR